MRHVVSQRDEAADRGRAARREARRWTWDHAAGVAWREIAALRSRRSTATEVSP